MLSPLKEFFFSFVSSLWFFFFCICKSYWLPSAWKHVKIDRHFKRELVYIYVTCFPIFNLLMDEKKTREQLESTVGWEWTTGEGNRWISWSDFLRMQIMYLMISRPTGVPYRKLNSFSSNLFMSSSKFDDKSILM